MVGFSMHQTSFSQVLQVNPPSLSPQKIVAIPHAAYPSSFILSEPEILSINLNVSGDKVVKLQQSAETTSLIITDIKSGKNTEIKTNSIKNASHAHFLNDQLIALEINGESSYYEILEISSSSVLATIPSNKFIGSTSIAAYFSNQNGISSTIEKFDFGTKRLTTEATISGEVFGWYFSSLKGVVGVAVHNRMISNIYAVENNKLGSSLFEFSSNYYFETKGCNSTGDVFYAITNFQSVTTYACAVSKSGIKPLNAQTRESCTDIFIHGNDVVLSNNNINAAEYQESKDATVQKIIAFATQGFKGSSVQILDYSEKNNSILFCVESEILKPAYFVWQNNKAVPVSSDKYAAKNLTFISSEVAMIQTGEVAPQSGRMFLPTKNDKSTYPLVIYIPENIFLPYSNQFNPTVQHLCQSGYAVFVWNTRFSFRSKNGFTYSDLVASFPEDFELILAFLKREYRILPENTHVIGEGLGGYLALNACAQINEGYSGAVVFGIDFPGKIQGQDLMAARMFGEDAQSKWSTLDRMKLSEHCHYLVYSSKKSISEEKLANSAKQSKIIWAEFEINSQRSNKVNAKQLDEIANWLRPLSKFETQVIEDKPKVDVNKK